MKLLVLIMLAFASTAMTSTKCSNGFEISSELQEFLKQPRVLELVFEIEKQSHNKRVLQATGNSKSTEMYTADKAYSEASKELLVLANNQAPKTYYFAAMKIRSSSAVLGTYTAHLQQQLEEPMLTRIAQSPLARIYVVDELGRAIAITTAQDVSQFIGSERLSSNPSLIMYSAPLTKNDSEKIYESQVTSNNLVRCN